MFKLAKFRATKQEEKRAEVAQTVWMAVFRFALTLRAMLNQGSVTTTADKDEQGLPKKESQKFFEAYADRYKLLLEAGNSLLDAWGVATLFLDKPVTDALGRFWKVRADILTSFTMYAISLDGKGDLLKAHEKHFSQETANAIDQREKELRTLLEPIARLNVG